MPPLLTQLFLHSTHSNPLSLSCFLPLIQFYSIDSSMYIQAGVPNVGQTREGCIAHKAWYSVWTDFLQRCSMYCNVMVVDGKRSKHAKVDVESIVRQNPGRIGSQGETKETSFGGWAREPPSCIPEVSITFYFTILAPSLTFSPVWLSTIHTTPYHTDGWLAGWVSIQM